MKQELSLASWRHSETNRGLNVQLLRGCFNPPWYLSSSGESRSCVKCCWCGHISTTSAMNCGHCSRKSLCQWYIECLLRSLPSLSAYQLQWISIQFHKLVESVENSVENEPLKIPDWTLSHRDGIHHLICSWASGKSCWLILNRAYIGMPR